MKNRVKKIIVLFTLFGFGLMASMCAARQNPIKDPFHQKIKKQKRPIKKKVAKISVKGIAFIDKKNASALLECGKKTKLITKGNSFKKFVVKDIKRNCVVLENNGKKITIFFED